MSNTSITDAQLEASLRDSLIHRLIAVNVDIADGASLISIAGRLGAMTVVTAKQAGLNKAGVMTILESAYEQAEKLQEELKQQCQTMLNGTT